MDAETKEVVQQKDQVAQRKYNNLKHHLLFSTTGLVFAIAVGGGVYLWQHGAVVSFNASLASQKNENKALTRDKANLATQNASLEKTLQVLQRGTTANNDTTAGVTVAPGPVAKMSVTTVKDQPGTDFGTPNYTPPQGTQRVVYLTIANLTDSTQSYNTFQFQAITKGGVVETPRLYAPAESKGIWYSSKLVAGGSQDIVLLFDPSQDISTLTWSPVGSSTPITASLPEPVIE